ncbi:hypothetical protein [Actinoplanes sp. NPDC051494]|uniref:hypothetical protein n=1 Tax=Actinoplanes sp. NPDC051494 TaxID=3363907 RepID=UPI003798E4D4
MGTRRAGPVIAAYVAVVTLLSAFPALPVARAAVLALTLPAGLLLPTGPLGGVPPRVAGILLAAVCALGNAFLVRAVRWALRPRRAEAAVGRRLEHALTTLRLPVTPMARSRGTVRDGPWRLRRERSLLLRDVPIAFRELTGVCRGLWTAGGLWVQERAEPPALRAFDSAGYEFRLEPAPGPFGDAVLTVSAPPRRDLGFLTGLVLAGVPAVFFLTGRGLLPAAPDPDLVLTVGLVTTGIGALVAGVVAVLRPATRHVGAGLLMVAAVSAYAII